MQRWPWFQKSVALQLSSLSQTRVVNHANGKYAHVLDIQCKIFPSRLAFMQSYDATHHMYGEVYWNPFYGFFKGAYEG